MSVISISTVNPSITEIKPLEEDKKDIQELNPVWTDLVRNTLCSIEQHQALRELTDLRLLDEKEMQALRGVKEEVADSKMIKFLRGFQQVSKLAMTFFFGEAALTGIWAFIGGLIPEKSMLLTSESFFFGFPLDYALAGLACKVNTYALSLLEGYWIRRMVAHHSEQSDLLGRVKKMAEVGKNEEINAFIDTNKEFLSDEKFSKVKGIQEAIKNLEFLKTKAFMIGHSHLQAIESNLTPEIFSVLKA